MYQKFQTSPIAEGVDAEANVYFETMEVDMAEEYELLDFPAMVAAVGGFVGMMLGWSAKDLAWVAHAALEKWFKT